LNLFRVSVTGPESTGKSLLTKQLALHYHTLFVPEVAREYLADLGRLYEFEDIVYIAKKQLDTENEQAEKAGDILFCDTDLLVTKIWSLYKYGKCDPWIEEHVNCHRYDLYLLCDIDLPWQDDPLREHPENRKELFGMYKEELISLGVNFSIIRGKGKLRLMNAISVVERTFKNAY
jgi:NadR type nicotinamide-nucleotide adenylyltransferase